MCILSTKHILPATYLFLFLYSLNLAAQKKRIHDQFIYKVDYQVTARLDSLDSEFVVIEENHLLIGSQISCFSSKGMRTVGNIRVSKNISSTPKGALTEFPFIVFKNKKESKLYFVQKIGYNDFVYHEELNQFQWIIEEESKMIGEYQCQKATTNWGGRQYTAWFTMDLPISEGPYKFFGLPGLIVSIKDDQNHYEYKLKSLAKLSKPLEFTLNLKEYVKITKKQMNEQYKLYSLNPHAYLNDPNIKVDPKVLNHYKKVFAERSKKRNNPIELNE